MAALRRRVERRGRTAKADAAAVTALRDARRDAPKRVELITRRRGSARASW
jgi:hypothetical protein